MLSDVERGGDLVQVSYAQRFLNAIKNSVASAITWFHDKFIKASVPKVDTLPISTTSSFGSVAPQVQTPCQVFEPLPIRPEIFTIDLDDDPFARHTREHYQPVIVAPTPITAPAQYPTVRDSAPATVPAETTNCDIITAPAPVHHLNLAELVRQKPTTTCTTSRVTDTVQVRNIAPYRPLGPKRTVPATTITAKRQFRLNSDDHYRRADKHYTTAMNSFRTTALETDLFPTFANNHREMEVKSRDSFEPIPIPHLFTKPYDGPVPDIMISDFDEDAGRLFSFVQIEEWPEENMLAPRTRPASVIVVLEPEEDYYSSDSCYSDDE